MSIRVFSPAILALALPLAALRGPDPNAVPMQHADSMAVMRGESLKWSPLQLPGFKPGLETSVLEGDPGKPGPYTLRLRFPGGYTIPAHFHPTVENVTVLSGRFFLGMGARASGSAMREYAPGDFLSIPAQMAHFGRVEGVTVVQLHGAGPFVLKLAEPQAGASGP